MTFFVLLNEMCSYDEEHVLIYRGQCARDDVLPHPQEVAQHPMQTDVHPKRTQTQTQRSSVCKSTMKVFKKDFLLFSFVAVWEESARTTCLTY